MARAVYRTSSPTSTSARGPFGQTAELREASRHLFETLRFDRQDLDRLRQLGRRVAAESRDREADRRERVLELVRHLSRALAQSRGAFRFERACSAQLQLAGHVAHSSPQHLEFRRAASRRRRRQRLASPDARRPADELLQRATQTSAQMSRHARGDDADDAAPRRPWPGPGAAPLSRATKSVCAREHDALSQRFLVHVQRRAAARRSGGRHAWSPRPPFAARRRAVPRCRRADEGKHERAGGAPGERDQDRRDEGEAHQDQKEAAAEPDTLHRRSVRNARDSGFGVKHTDCAGP